MKFSLIFLLSVFFFISCKKPEACIYISDEKDKFKVNEPIKLISCSLEAKKYNWDFGDGSTHTDADVQVFHTYKSPGIYTVELEVKNGSNKDTASKTLIVE